MINILRLTPTRAAQYRAQAAAPAANPAGTEPFAFKAGEEFVADVHMWCDVGGSAL